MPSQADAGSSRRRLVLAAIVLLTMCLGARDITDPASGMLGGDMARYMMDGVFVHDLAARGGAWSLESVKHEAELYFAKYPALSLGHHPPLPYLALTPMFTVFGLSITAARLTAIGWFLLATGGLYLLIKRLAGWHAATWASLLFITNVFVLRFGQYVLSEMPMLALELLAVNALLTFSDSGRLKHFVWFVVAVVASLFAKQTAAFIFPVYAVILISRFDFRRLLNRRFLVIAGIGLLVLVPFVVMTISLAPQNVDFVVRQVSRLAAGQRQVLISTILGKIFVTHLSVPTMVAVLLGAAGLIASRHQLFTIGAAWVIAVIGGTVLFAGGVESARYAFAALPAYFMLAAGLVVERRSKIAQVGAVTLLSCVLLWQLWLVRDVRPTGAGGYETAAQYVLDHSASPVVMYDSSVDTGYFVFYVRAHDSSGRLITLRADKVLVSESERANRELGPDRARDAAAFEGALKLYGVQYIVIEDRIEGAQILTTMREELKTDRFIERQRIPVVSRELEARGMDLVVYEYRNAQPPDPDAEVFIGLPMGNREIKVHLRDLLVPGGR
ncbi:MAG TPA: glycosyltransferase family 39 protein [Vicinamibacterales bacterium]|nr:glycosyltransferase family 39 protein [Vicinamibacterales bacterium]